MHIAKKVHVLMMSRFPIITVLLQSIYAEYKYRNLQKRQQKLLKKANCDRYVYKFAALTAKEHYQTA